MRSWTIIGCAVLAGILLSVGIYVWSGPSAPQSDAMQIQDPGPQGRGGRGGRDMGGEGNRPFNRGERGGPQGRGPQGDGPPGMFFQGRDSFNEALILLGEANLSPDFNLSLEQEQKILAIRNEVKAARDKWFADNQAEFRKLSEQFDAAREGGQREQLRDLFQKRQQLTQSMPRTEQAVRQLRAVLTADQLKALDAYAAAKRAEEEQLRQQVGELFGGGRRTEQAAAAATQPARRAR